MQKFRKSRTSLGRASFVTPGMLLLGLVWATHVTAATQPYPARIAANLVSNPMVSGVSGWTLGYGAVYDGTVSHLSDRSGAIDLSVPGSEVDSGQIPVVSGVTYSVSAYLKSTSWPATAYVMVGVYDAAGTFITNANIDYQATTGPGVWEEIQTQYTAKPGDAYLVLKVSRWDASTSPAIDGNMWVDDFYVGSPPSFDQPPAPKTVFNGGSVSVDALGNFRVNRNGTWQPYFPFCFYNADQGNAPANQARLNLFSAQGFNCTMYNMFSTSWLQQAQNAVSPYNPGGMMSMIQFNQYIVPADPLYNKLGDLDANMKLLAQSPYFNNVLGYYWDNEQWNQYAVPRDVTSIIKLDDTVNGQRQHPIYMLQGGEAMTRALRGMIDVAGDYLRDGLSTSVRELSTAHRFSLLSNLQGQTVPTGIGIISEESTTTGLRRLVYQALIAGVKGLAYFKDGGCYANYNGPTGVGCTDMTQRASWAEFPRLRTEIDQMMPLIQQPHWTDWKAEVSGAAIQVGTRDYNGEGYLILVNTSDVAVVSAFTLTGMAYGPTKAVDYFNGTQAAAVLANSCGTPPASAFAFAFAKPFFGFAPPAEYFDTARRACPIEARFTATLAANATAVYRLAR